MLTRSFGVQAGPLKKMVSIEKLNFKNRHMRLHAPDGTEWVLLLLLAASRRSDGRTTSRKSG